MSLLPPPALPSRLPLSEIPCWESRMEHEGGRGPGTTHASSAFTECCSISRASSPHQMTGRSRRLTHGYRVKLLRSHTEILIAPAP